MIPGLGSAYVGIPNIFVGFLNSSNYDFTHMDLALSWTTCCWLLLRSFRKVRLSFKCSFNKFKAESEVMFTRKIINKKDDWWTKWRSTTSSYLWSHHYASIHHHERYQNGGTLLRPCGRSHCAISMPSRCIPQSLISLLPLLQHRPACAEPYTYQTSCSLQYFMLWASIIEHAQFILA